MDAEREKRLGLAIGFGTVAAFAGLIVLMVYTGLVWNTDYTGATIALGTFIPVWLLHTALAIAHEVEPKPGLVFVARMLLTLCHVAHTILTTIVLAQGTGVHGQLVVLCIEGVVSYATLGSVLTVVVNRKTSAATKADCAACFVKCHSVLCV